MERKLASIQKIVDIQPIKDADRIELATTLGWQVVIAKSENFKIGNLIIYIETDSIVPERPEFEFLRERKFRVRTIKLKKTISQGLILPLSILPNKNYKEGQDISELLGIKKYDPQAELEERLESEKQSRQKNKIDKFLKRWSWYRKLFGKKRKGGFPSFIKKTDETRLQTIPHILEEYKNDIFSVSEKLDGTSLTCFMIQDKTWYGKKKYTFGVCSRNIYLSKQDTSNYWKIAKKYNIENVLRNIIGNNKCVVLQGEIIGAGIQENKYGLKDLDFYAFNLIFDNVKFNNYNARQLLQEQNIKFVPIINNSFKLKSTVNEMVDYSNGKSLVATNTLREGIVCRNYEKDISFKVVSPEFLLKYGE